LEIKILNRKYELNINMNYTKRANFEGI